MSQTFLQLPLSPFFSLFCPLFPFLVAEAGPFQTQEPDQTAPATTMTSYIPLPFSIPDKEEWLSLVFTSATHCLSLFVTVWSSLFVFKESNLQGRQSDQF